MSFDKLGIINDVLAETGNNLVAVADDGSDEWTVCSPAYEKAVKSTVEIHNWSFDTNVATLNRVGDSPDDLFNDAYAKPDGALSIEWVRINDAPGDYRIINNQICLSSRGYVVTCKFTIDNGAANWPPLFADIIRLLVRAAVYRGLHEDPGQADKEESKAMAVLQTAMTRVDQDQPKRALFNSRAISARYTRRPFVRTPFPFGGTGVAS